MIDARAELISSVTSPIPDDPGFTKFLEQMRTLAYLTEFYGQRLGQNEWGLQNKQTESGSLNTLLDTSKDHNRYYPKFCIFRYVTMLTEGKNRGFPVSTITLRLDQMIEIQSAPDFYPESVEFETPVPDPQYFRPYDYVFGLTGKTYKKATESEVQLRGPITSLGDKVKSYMYDFTDKFYAAYFPNEISIPKKIS